MSEKFPKKVKKTQIKSLYEEIDDKFDANIPYRYRRTINEVKNNLDDLINLLEKLKESNYEAVRESFKKYIVPLYVNGKIVLKKLDNIEDSEIKRIETLGFNFVEKCGYFEKTFPIIATLKDFSNKGRVSFTVHIENKEDYDEEIGDFEKIINKNENIPLILISKSIKSDIKKWEIIFHELSHSTGTNKNNNFKDSKFVTEIFSDLLSAEIVGISYFLTLINVSNDINIKNKKGNHPPWNVRINTVFDHLMNKDNALDSILKRKKEEWREKVDLNELSSGEYQWSNIKNRAKEKLNKLKKNREINDVSEENIYKIVKGEKGFNGEGPIEYHMALVLDNQVIKKNIVKKEEVNKKIDKWLPKKLI